MRYLTLILILLIPVFTFTQTTFQSVQSGDWDLPFTWGTQNSFPSPGDTVIISPNHIVDYVFPLDIGNGGKLVVRGRLDLVGGLDLPPASKLTVTGIGSLHIGGNPTGYLVCDSCTFINNGSTHVTGTIELKSGSEFHNNCLLSNAMGVIDFNSGLVRAVVSPGAIIDSEGPVIIGTALELNSGMITTSALGDIEVLSGAKVTGYGSDIMADGEIINNGIIEGQNPGFHTLWDTDCSISGSGTTNYVWICDSANHVDLCIPGSPLSVDIISIQATTQLDGSIAVRWEVATEQNFSHYEVQRSYGDDWDMVGIVESKYNNLPVGGSYERVDSPLPGTIYYRLKMVNIGGSSEYSYIVSAKVRLPSEIIEIYPNPSTEFLSLKTEIENLNGIQIIDLSGRVLKILPLTGNENIQLEVSDLPAGVYLLEIQKTNRTIIQKFTKN